MLDPNCSGILIFIAVMADNSFVSKHDVFVEVRAHGISNIVNGDNEGKGIYIRLHNGKDSDCLAKLTRDEAWKLLEILTAQLKKYEGMTNGN